MMKKKISLIFASLFLVFALWAQNPTKDFPYYYYNSSEKNYYDYAYIMRYPVKTLEDNNEWTVTLYKSGNTHYIVTQYKSGKQENEATLKSVLKKHKSVYKELDSKIDADKGTNYNVCLLFFDYGNNLICSAQYSENY